MPFDLLLVLAAALWGAAAGTLLPRPAHRFSVPLPEPEDTEPEDTETEAETAAEAFEGYGWRDACPAGHPVTGWLGPARCAPCGGVAYGPRPLPFAVVTALLCAVLAAATGTRPELAVWLLLAPVGVLLAAVDLAVHRLPDPLTLPLAAAAPALLGAAALLPEHAGDWTTALLGTVALGGAYLVLHLLNPSGMAFGDVKLSLGAGAVLGWYGWPTVMLGTLAAFVLGALYGGVLVLARRADRRTVIPFGPFLLAGTLTGVLIGAGAA
ncbi:A24 family peptidase [Streptomyces longwoodensis]|uniref:A24 family peptidase n=1 Tax=Streptomyces longwoodensis TaxID=68231 RepID=UPI0033E9EFCC